jgi:hypothetical protein
MVICACGLLPNPAKVSNFQYRAGLCSMDKIFRRRTIRQKFSGEEFSGEECSANHFFIEKSKTTIFHKFIQKSVSQAFCHRNISVQSSYVLDFPVHRLKIRVWLSEKIDFKIDKNSKISIFKADFHQNVSFMLKSKERMLNE